ncbi:methyl-accepting chemotaxis protein [Curvibacter gracilis]|uniref:methyl-accepting chemotaxis protein n=1 Tax=Curvibacter gracilis TaxID=230310 RepID=UPI0004845A40|nr:methyl-accepting chemotaxis protein [Curvibacter gracilis]
MRWNDWKLGVRLAFAFGLLLLMSLLITGLGMTRIQALRQANEQLSTVEMERQALVQDWFNDLQMNWLRTEASFKADNAAYLDKIRRDMAAVVNAQSQRIDRTRALMLLGPEQQSFAQALEAREAYRGTRADLQKQQDAGQNVAEQVDQRLYPLFKTYEERLTQLKQAVTQRVNEETRDNLALAERSLYWLAGAALAAVLVGLWLAWRITRSVTGPVGQAVQVAQAIAQGDLAQTIESSSKDESGTLLRSLADMQAHLAGIVREVRHNADGVANTSAEIAQGNNDLSARTEQQASALQQTAASMEQLGSTVKQNAETARNANERAHAASLVAERGGTVVHEVVQTMKGINESSQKIGDIIGVIDSIAFQTNILALNAAVEAARAGEQGRGFAVVAGEVRSLASRSAEAAREIKSLIGASVERVEQGSALVDRAGHTMDEVVAAIQDLTRLMGEISSASAEQSAGLGQVSEAVSQMDHATQQNAALVEESAAAAISLRNQAERLVQSVAVFRLAQGPTGATQPAVEVTTPRATRSPVPPSKPYLGPERRSATRPGPGATAPNATGEPGWASL